MSRLPIRWKLTIWYSAFFAVVLLLLGGGLYLGLRDRLFQSLEEQVAVQERLGRERIRTVDGQPEVSGNLTLLDDDALVRIYTAESEVIARQGDAFSAEGALLTLVGDALEGRSVTTTVEVNGDPFQVRTAPIRDGSSIVGAIQVALPGDDVHETLDIMLSMLAIAVPLVLAVGIVGGYVLAGRALSPVARITGLAARIGEDDLSSRLDLALPDDEVGRLAKTFDAMLERIEDAFMRQRRFTGDVAHELRTPLGLMRSQVDLALARPRSADAYREALQGLDEDLDRLVRMVGTLLTLARADAGQLSLDRASFDLAETIDAVFDQYAPMAESAGIDVERDATSTRVVADEGLLIQVMVNLLDNAIAHTPPQGRITIGCRLDGETARFWVSDTGPGIPPEHRQRVFDRFYRTDTGRTRAQGGVGLGLAIAKAIVDAHGGAIGISDIDGLGTLVEVHLPAAR